MRNLAYNELNYVFGGDETGGGSIVVVGNPPPSDPTGGTLSNPTGTGGSGSSTNQTASQMLQGMTRVTIGRHNLFLPPEASETAAEKTAVQAYKDGLVAADAKIATIADNSQVSVTERWTDSSGHQQQKTYTETGADFKNAWNKQSFAIIPDATLTNNPNLNNNNTGRGSASLGADPFSSGNIVAGFALDKTIRDYYSNATANGNPASNGVGAEMYLALHEVAHNTTAGLAMNADTGVKVDTTAANTPNHANENGANTLAISLAKAIGLNLGTIANPNGTGVTNGYDGTATWAVPASTGGSGWQPTGWQ